MARVGFIAALLGLTCAVALAQTTTCLEYAGGVIKCSTPQGLSHSPGPLGTNCQIGIGSVSCSHPQQGLLEPIQPPASFHSPQSIVITSPLPAVPNFLQLQRDEMHRSREQTDSMLMQLQQQEYREQQLELQGKLVELLEKQQSQRAVASVEQPNVDAVGSVSQQIIECGNDYGCDTSILHKRGGPMNITGETGSMP